MMQSNKENNKRIAKNTLLLYARMLLTMIISLYTSRVILAALGFEDYGLYNVVGGIVTMFTFINYAMGNSSNRYITYALGKGNKQEIKDVFSATILIHLIIAVIIILLSETIGLWFLYNKMVIPESRMVAAFWVFQFSVISCAISITRVPFSALIIAHEKMSAFAFVSILDAILKLLIAILIQFSSSDRLILYAFLILSIEVLNRVIYHYYCWKHFEEARHIKIYKVPQLKEMTSFAGWSLIGNLAFIGYTQGLNILLNVFFGPAVNAARGIAVQVENAVKGFVSNFQTAVNPQIIKTYAQEDFDRLHVLIFSSSKFSFFLLYCMALPICIESKGILALWLKDVPQYASIFTVIILLISLSEPLRNPIDRANQATGKIKVYQIIEGGLLLLIVPLSYLFLKLGCAPYFAFVVQLLVMYGVQVVRLFIVCPKIRMSKREYVKQVLIKITVVALCSSILPLFLHYLLPNSYISIAIVIIASIASVLIFSYYLGLTRNEKNFVNQRIKMLTSRIKC